MIESTRKHVLAQLVASALFVASTGAAALNGPVYPAPGGNSFSSSGTSAGDAGGKTNSYGAFDTSAFATLYWGPDDSVGPPTTPNAGLDGNLYPMMFDSIAGTSALWDTMSPYHDPTTGTTSTQTIWFAIQISGLGPLPWVLASVVGLPSTVGAVVDDSAGLNYMANLQFTVGSPGGTPINSLQQSSANLTRTNFTGAFYFTNPAAEATVPEPGTLALIGASMVGVVAIARRRRDKCRAAGGLSHE